MGRVRAWVRAGGAVLVAILAGALFSTAAEAAPGDLDTTFSTDGTQRTDFLTGESQAAAVVRQQDGKIVAVGLNFADGPSDFAVARYNADGSPDTSFSGDGRQVTDIGGTGDDRANGVALQADGKIVVVGAAADDFAVARYNSNGSLDTSFSGDGKQTTDLGGVVTGDGANGVAIQANGKIVAVGVAGATSHASPNDFGLVRYNPNGSLDTTFSGDGKQRTDFGFESDEARGVAIQGDGKIVAVGGEGVEEFGDFALARYNPNGSLDTSFSGDGKQTTDFGGFDNANAVALDSDGRIVAAGSASVGTGRDFALARYNANGSLDTSFSGDGKQTTDFGSLDGAQGVAIQADGKIVAVGATGAVATAVHSEFALARYNPNGSLDPSFSGDGKQTTDFGGIGGRFGEGATGVAAPANGKIVAVGTADESGISRLRARPLQHRRHARRELLRGRQADDRLRGLRRRQRRGAPGRWQDRHGWRYLVRRERLLLPGRLRARALQRERFARSELLRGREADERVRRRGVGGGAPERRQDRRGRDGRCARRRRRRRRLRARPLQPERLARPDFFRGWQADNRLRALRPSERSGDPGKRQDRRGR